MNEKYVNVLKRLYMTNKFKKKKVDLDAMTKACKLLNNPEKSVRYIHVTGTNGKGSTALKLASIFQKSKMKTGLFTSPHINTFRERIKVNNEMISKEYIIHELSMLYKLNDEYNLDLTFFEFVTLLAFNYYRDMKAEITVLEVGLGGNLDATNVVDPLMSVITSIGMDHMDSLGYTLREIAEKKAGIIKPNRPALIGLDCNPKDVFIERAKSQNSKLYLLENFQEEFSNVYRNFEKENNLLVIKTVQILIANYPELFHHITNSDCQFGIQQKQPCRLEDVFMHNSLLKNKFPPNVSKIFLDVAHNIHAMAKLLPDLRNSFPRAQLFIIAGFSANKDKHELFKVITQYADRIFLTSSDHPRSVKYDELGQLYKEFLNCGLFCEEGIFSGAYEINEALHKAKEESSLSQRETIFLICGTFFIMKDYRKLLGYNEEQDPLELNEINSVKFNL